MNKLNISKRDIKVFFIGMFIMLLVVLIYDWREFKSGFSAGYEKAGKGKAR